MIANQVNPRLLTKFILRNIRDSKLRNFIIILTTGIVTTLVLIILIMTSNTSESMKHIFQQQAGTRAHIVLHDVGIDEINKLLSKKDTVDFGIMQPIGQIINFNAQKLDQQLFAMDSKYIDHNFVKLVGREPVKSNEIAVNPVVMKKLGISAEIGKSITLEWQKYNGETERQSYQVVGHWSGAAINGIWVSSSYFTSDLVSSDVSVFFNEQNLEAAIDKTVQDLQLTDKQYEVNWAYDSNTQQVLKTQNVLYYIAILIIAISGILILYNIMQISVKLDIKLYGRMRTLGAGARQIKWLVYCQLIISSMIGLAVGLFMGAGLGKYITARELGNISTLDLKVGSINIVYTAGIILLAVIFSGFIPAHTASKVSATEILKEDNSFGFGETRKKNWPGCPVLFQLSLVSLGRNKIRSVITIGFMALGLIMLSCVFVISQSFDIDKYLNELSISHYSVADSSFLDEKSAYSPDTMILSNELVAEIEKIDGIIGWGRLMTQEVDLTLPQKIINHITSYYEANNREIINYMAYDVNWNQGYDKMVKSNQIAGIIYGIDGLVTESLVKGEHLLQGTFDAEKFNSGNYVIAQGILDPSRGNIKQPTYQVGDKIILGDKEFEIMAIVEAPSPVTEGKKSSNAAFALSFYIHHETFQNIYSGNNLRKLYFNVNSSGNKKVESLLADLEKDQVSVTSNKTLTEQYHKETKAMMLVQVLVSIMVFGIGLMNLINSLITATATRKKEFGIMQSLGMTKKQLRTLLLFEGLNYSVITLAISYFVSLLLISTVVKKYLEGQWSATYRLMIDPLLIFTPIIIIISVITPLICYIKIVKVAPIKRLELES